MTMLTKKILSTLSPSAIIASCAFGLFASGCAGSGAPDDTGSGGSSSSGGNGGKLGFGGSNNPGSGGSKAGGSGGGNNPGSGGTSTNPGSGGTPATSTLAGCEKTIAPEDLVSDFEDGGNGVKMVNGRNGGWYTYNDATGTQTPPPMGAAAASVGGACNTGFAFKSTGKGFTAWGAGIGTDLAPAVMLMKQLYNASAYSGVRFFARAGAATAVRFKIQDKNTTPEGGVCKTKCDDNFGTQLSLTSDWTLFEVKFSELTQEGWGEAFPKLESDKIFGIQFQVKGGTDFEIWIDQVAFTK